MNHTKRYLMQQKIRYNNSANTTQTSVVRNINATVSNKKPIIVTLPKGK